MGDFSGKQKDLFRSYIMQIAMPFDKLREMCRKDVILKKKFELMDNLMSDILITADPTTKKNIERYNEMIKKENAVKEETPA
jgi:hypothetical protein